MKTETKYSLTFTEIEQAVINFLPTKEFEGMKKRPVVVFDVAPFTEDGDTSYRLVGAQVTIERDA